MIFFLNEIIEYIVTNDNDRVHASIVIEYMQALLIRCEHKFKPHVNAAHVLILAWKIVQI